MTGTWVVPAEPASSFNTNGEERPRLRSALRAALYAVPVIGLPVWIAEWVYGCCGSVIHVGEIVGYAPGHQLSSTADIPGVEASTWAFELTIRAGH